MQGAIDGRERGGTEFVNWICCLSRNLNTEFSLDFFLCNCSLQLFSSFFYWDVSEFLAKARGMFSREKDKQAAGERLYFYDLCLDLANTQDYPAQPNNPHCFHISRRWAPLPGCSSTALLLGYLRDLDSCLVLQKMAVVTPHPSPLATAVHLPPAETQPGFITKQLFLFLKLKYSWLAMLY